MECKTAGTGNDYIGKINVTRSKRVCQFWSAKHNDQNNYPPSQETRDFFGNILKPGPHPEVKRPSSDFEYLMNMHNISIYKDTKSGKNIMLVHGIRDEYMNDSLYADMSVENAENFCRNPERNLGGNTATYNEIIIFIPRYFQVASVTR